MEQLSTFARLRRYWPQYKWANVWEMIKNNSLPPKEYSGDFRGKLVVISGATSGIGYHTARRYARSGADLITINRNAEKSAALCDEIRRAFGVQCDASVAELSVGSDLHRAAGVLKDLSRPIDVLIHNAGVFLKKRTETIDGLETTFVVHYLSSFIINYMLLDKLRQESRARIIFVSSEGYRFAVWGLNFNNLQFERGGYSALKAYGSAKVAQILSMHRFADLFKGTGVTINAMHPGMVATNSGNENHAFYRWYKKHIIDRNSLPPTVAAEALYYLGAAPELAGVTDTFFNLTTEESLAPQVMDLEMAEFLWPVSMKLGKLS